MKKLKDNIFYIIGGIIFTLSSAILSFQLIIADYYSNWNIIITLLISMIVASIFWKNTIKEEAENIKLNKLFSIICVILVIIVMIKLYLTKGILYEKMFKYWIFNPFQIRGFIASSISAMYIGIYIARKIKNWIKNFYNSLDSWEKKSYVIATIISFLVIVIAYNLNQNWYTKYDKVYSIDSGYCTENILPKPTYYDIRHPILSIFTFPVWAIVDTLVSFVLKSSDVAIVVKAIIFQLINAQLLILIGLQIKKLTNNKLSFIMYMLSFATILYTMFFEKYQLAVFFIVLYVFGVCNNKKWANSAIISSAGIMPTSCVIGICEFIKSEKFTKKILNVLKIIIFTIVIFICLGRGHLIKYGMSEMIAKKEIFSNETYTVKEKVISTTKMIQSSIVALPSEYNTERKSYWWTDLEKQISIIGIIIIALIILGAIKNRKDLFIKICSIWVAFSGVLFILLNWSTQESPLFNIYFSWAIIPLFVMGIDYLIKKIKLNPKFVYSVLLAFMIIINVSTMLNIQNYMFKL